ncbi:hypothetical protein V1525DRAFT_392712 [Lipomyces kononenkoae]|uniref:Uncharacterized protein n=1 Tax=Lipomyces kononenkoae TaxID=34357 RepID=A0ACC3TC77_LIPKO
MTMLSFGITKISDLYYTCNTRLGDVLSSILKTPNDQPQGTARCINAVMVLLRSCLRKDTWISYLTWSFLLGLLMVDLVVLTYSVSTYLGMVVTM